MLGPGLKIVLLRRPGNEYGQKEVNLSGPKNLKDFCPNMYW